MNVGISYGVGISKSFMDLDSKRIIVFQKWRLRKMVVKAWKIWKLQGLLCNVFVGHSSAIYNIKSLITTKL